MDSRHVSPSGARGARSPHRFPLAPSAHVRRPTSVVLALAVVALAGPPARAQSILSSDPGWRTHNIVIPQCRAIPAPGRNAVTITGVDARIDILQQVATTRLDIALANPGRERLEAELLVPVPSGAVVRGFSFEGAGGSPSAQVLPKADAAAIYDAIVAKAKDPALLEFAGYQLVRSSVFPVEPGGTQKVRLIYEHILSSDAGRVDYLLPRSELLSYSVPWNVSLKVRAESPISTLYSPSHALTTTRTDERSFTAKLPPAAVTQPGSFRLSYLLEKGPVTGSFMAYPDASIGGGYFLLLGGLPARPRADADAPAIRRAVTLVVDRSGSMSGEKLEQAREAAFQVIGGLDDGEAFNVVLYDSDIDVYSPHPVIKTPDSHRAVRAYLAGVRSGGGTNIHGALSRALSISPLPGYLPLVIFLTDGLPTTGVTSEVAIRELATKGNAHSQRIFSFGVGVDVNTPLLEALSRDSRGAPTFVLPGEDVELAVAQVFRRLRGPVLASPTLRVVDAGGEPAPGRTRELFPATLPDLFEGDQVVVLGQYVGDAPLRFELTGDGGGQPRRFRLDFDPAKASTRNAFVPRLWASRKIAGLVDRIRRLGAAPGTVVENDPRLKELVEAVVRLSKEHGVLTEYTAFLAREGTDLARSDEVIAAACDNFQHRAVACRSGLASVNQSVNNSAQLAQSALNISNRFLDENLKVVEVTRVQQVNDLAYWRQGGRWVDSRVVGTEKAATPAREVEFGSEAFRELLGRLTAEGRQGAVALQGDILLVVDGETVLVRAPKS